MAWRCNVCGFRAAGRPEAHRHADAHADGRPQHLVFDLPAGVDVSKQTGWASRRPYVVGR